MPMNSKRVPLDVPGKFIVAENSQRVNAISVTNISANARFRFDLGNSQLTSEIVSRGRLKIGKGNTMTDKEEGVYLVNEVAQVGGFVDMTVSYQRAGDPPTDGIEFIAAS